MIQRQFAPHIHTEINAPFMYLNVLVALMPMVCASIFNYGLKALLLIMFSMILFFLSDRVCSSLFRGSNSRTTSRKNNSNTDYYDLSSLVSGLIFALMLPANTPIWVVAVGVLFASVIVKQMMGGVGSNVFNPAISGRLFIELCFPEACSLWAKTHFEMADVSSFFMLDEAKEIEKADLTTLHFVEILSGEFATYIGLGCGVIILIGALYLIGKGIIRGYAFVGYNIGVTLMYLFFNMANILSFQGIREFAVFYLTSGVIFISAFALGDFTTMPVNRTIRFFLSLLAGAYTYYLMRSGAPEVSTIVALCVPVLLLNIATPIADFFGMRSRKEGGDAL